MGKRKLSLEPQNVTKELWYYEEPKGILIVHEIYSKNEYLRTDQLLIPWKMIRASLKRKDNADG